LKNEARVKESRTGKRGGRGGGTKKSQIRIVNPWIVSSKRGAGVLPDEGEKTM